MHPSAKASLELDPTSKSSATQNIQTELVGRCSTWAEAKVWLQRLTLLLIAHDVISLGTAADGAMSPVCAVTKPESLHGKAHRNKIMVRRQGCYRLANNREVRRSGDSQFQIMKSSIIKFQFSQTPLGHRTPRIGLGDRRKKSIRVCSWEELFIFLTPHYLGNLPIQLLVRFAWTPLHAPLT